MITKIPKATTIKSFLITKGWQVAEKESPFFYLSPPSDIQFERKNFQYMVPIDEKAEDYQEYAYRLVSSISEVYEMNKWYMMDLLSLSIEEMKEDVRLKSAIIAAA